MPPIRSRLPHSSTLAGLACAFVLVLAGCGGNVDQADAETDGDGGRPPEPGEGAPALVVTLSGGPFGEGESVAFPLVEGLAWWERRPGGLNFRVAPADFHDSLRGPDWGLWLLLEGNLREGSRLAFRTGSQIVLDGVSYAPVINPDRPGTRTNHALDGGLDILYLDVRTRFLEGRLRSSLAPPDGGDPENPIKLEATLELYLDRPPPQA